MRKYLKTILLTGAVFIASTTTSNAPPRATQNHAKRFLVNYWEEGGYYGVQPRYDLQAEVTEDTIRSWDRKFSSTHIEQVYEIHENGRLYRVR
ncbi:MAG TPA: hypothetical protein VJH04_01400 [archaeon]|nr:hypothetical protein [archaeon]